jgi:probable F420-dependent oxidoreductase
MDNNSMKIGLRLPQTDKHRATKENIINLAKGAENAGFDSLWVLERLIWPINPQNPYPGTSDDKFPADWQYIFEPLETLAYVAANTEKIALGTSVIDMLFHNPVVLARRFATLDVLSEGRTICGLGIGWSKDEYQVSNIPLKNRGRRADEYIQILKKIWTENIVQFKGQYYHIPASKIGPKPIQKPHIPIYLGGYSQGTFERIANYASGWICIIRNSLDQVKSYIGNIRNECSKVKRDPEDVHIAAIVYPDVIGYRYNADNKESKEKGVKSSQRQLLSGNIDQIGKDLQEIKEMRVDHVILNFNRSSIGDNIDNIIDVSKQLSSFIT